MVLLCAAQGEGGGGGGGGGTKMRKMCTDFIRGGLTIWQATTAYPGQAVRGYDLIPGLWIVKA